MREQSHGEQGVWPVIQAEVESALLDLHEGSVFPETAAVEGGETKVGRSTALAADEFAATANVVLHPSRQEQVEGIPFHFAGVKGNAAHEVGEVVFADFDHQVGAGHLAPVFGFDEDGLEVGSEGCQGIQYEVMGSNVRAVPIGGMGDEDGCGGLLAQDVEKTNPGAVSEMGGLKRVDYGAATQDAADMGKAA